MSLPHDCVKYRCFAFLSKFGFSFVIGSSAFVTQKFIFTINYEICNNFFCFFCSKLIEIKDPKNSDSALTAIQLLSNAVLREPQERIKKLFLLGIMMIFEQ